MKESVTYFIAGVTFGLGIIFGIMLAKEKSIRKFEKSYYTDYSKWHKYNLKLKEDRYRIDSIETTDYYVVYEFGYDNLNEIVTLDVKRRLK